LLQKLDKLL